MPDRIVITGAPASGKTEFVQRLKQEPPTAGFVFFDELARRLLEENPSYRQNLRAFHREIYRLQTAREDEIRGESFVSDRGTVDAFAFHPETVADVGTSLEREYERYDSVIHLGSAAALGEPYYTHDAVRNESITDALTIERALKNVWEKHPGYHFVPAVVDFEEKYRSFLNTIRALLVKNIN